MHINKKMVKPPKVPQDEIDRFNKLPKERQERFEFLARYPEYLIEKKPGGFTPRYQRDSQRFPTEHSSDRRRIK